MSKVVVNSLFGANTHLPIVELQIDEKSLQMVAAKAREIAHMLMEAAEASTTDAFLHHWVTSVLGQTEAMAAQIICDFRQYREIQLTQVTTVTDSTEAVQ